MNTSFSQKLTETTVHEKVRKFYDIGSPYYYKIYGRHIHDGYYVTGKESKEEAQVNLIKLLAEKANITKGTRVLDIGCGVGGSSIWLAKHLGAVTTGITISPVQVKIAKKLAQLNRVNSLFFLMDAEGMEFYETFDVIWVIGVMTHLTDQEKFIKRATGYLNSGGRFVIFDWMPADNVTEMADDRYIKPVAEGMLLASLHPKRKYLEWFSQYGYRINFAENITDNTIRTWDDALSVIKSPAVWRLAGRVTLEEVAEVFKFLKSIQAMRLAMRKNKLISVAIVAEKI